MKNISIFLIIIAGAALYITTRPQNPDETRAQLISTLLCKRPNLPQILVDICEGKKAITSLFTMSSVNGGAAATPPNNNIVFNKGSFIPAPTAPAGVSRHIYEKGVFMDMQGNVTRIPFPQTYGGPTYPSQMCSNHKIAPCPRDGRECNRKTACGE